MAEFNGNTPYLTLGGTNLAARFVELKLGQSGDLVDVTHGAATFIQRNGGLRDVDFELTVGYDTATVSSYITLFKPTVTETLDYGPEGNTAGKPRHTQSLIIESVDGPNQTAKKDYVIFKVKGKSADAPTNDLINGATF